MWDPALPSCTGWVPTVVERWGSHLGFPCHLTIAPSLPSCHGPVAFLPLPGGEWFGTPVGGLVVNCLSHRPASRRVLISVHNAVAAEVLCTRWGGRGY